MARPIIQPKKEKWGGRFEVRRKGRRGWTKFENGEDGDIGGIFIKLGGIWILLPTMLLRAMILCGLSQKS